MFCMQTFLPWLSLQGQHYTMISDLSPRGGKPDDFHKTESAYSEIKHDHSVGQVETTEKTNSSEEHSLQPKEGWYLHIALHYIGLGSLVVSS